MFNKSKTPTKIRPAGQKSKEKSGVITNKNAESRPRPNTNNKQEKPDMRSEDRKN